MEDQRHNSLTLTRGTRAATAMLALLLLLIISVERGIHHHEEIPETSCHVCQILNLAIEPVAIVIVFRPVMTTVADVAGPEVRRTRASRFSLSIPRAPPL